MTDLGLKTFNKLYPMMIRKYQDLIVDQNASEKDKINQIIQKLNALGKLSNDVVRDWNTVYQWTMNDGLATDVNNKIEAMNANGELNTLLHNIFISLTGDMSTLHTTAKDTTVNAINEVDDLAKQLQTNQGDLSQLQTTDKDSLVHAINDNTVSLSQILIQVKSSGGDDTTNINNAINTVASKGGGKVLLPDANYSAYNIQLKTNVTLEGNQTIITKNGGDLTTNIINSTGTVTSTTSALSADAHVNDLSIMVVSTTGFNVGDYVLLYDNNYVYSTSGRNQEILRIASLTSTTISFASVLIGSYAIASTATIAKLSPIVNATIRGLILNIPSGTHGGGFYGTLNIGTIVERCTTLRPYENPGFCYDQSANCYIRNCVVKDGQDVATSGHGYGYSISNSSIYCYVMDSYSEAVRENPITYNTRHSGFINNVDKYSKDDSFNTHGTGNSYIYIKGNKSIGSQGFGINIGNSSQRKADSYIFIEDNIIVNCVNTGIYVTSLSNGTLNNTNISIKNNQIFNFGVSPTQGYGVVVNYTDGITITGNKIDGQNNAQSLYGISLLTVTKANVINNELLNIPSYGILYSTNCDNITIERNVFINIFSYGIRSLNTNTNVRVRHNTSDKNSYSFTADVREANIWGTKRDRDRGGTSVADGGTIPHNCPVAPTSIRVTGSVASQMVSVTAVSTTNFTVAIKTDTGTAGTTQTVYWEAEV